MSGPLLRMGLREYGQPGMLRLMTGLMTSVITQRKRAVYVPVTPPRTPAGPLQAQVKRPAGSLPSLAVDGSTLGVAAPYGGRKLADLPVRAKDRSTREGSRSVRSLPVGRRCAPSLSLYCLPSLASCLASLPVCCESALTC